MSRETRTAMCVSAAGALASSSSLLVSVRCVYLHSPQIHGRRDELGVVHESERLPVHGLRERIRVRTRLEELQNTETEHSNSKQHNTHIMQQQQQRTRCERGARENEWEVGRRCFVGGVSECRALVTGLAGLAGFASLTIPAAALTAWRSLPTSRPTCGTSCSGERTWLEKERERRGREGTRRKMQPGNGDWTCAEGARGSVHIDTSAFLHVSSRSLRVSYTRMPTSTEREVASRRRRRRANGSSVRGQSEVRGFRPSSCLAVICLRSLRLLLSLRGEKRVRAARDSVG